MRAVHVSLRGGERGKAELAHLVLTPAPYLVLLDVCARARDSEREREKERKREQEIKWEK